ncbi:methionine ABC transporter ATP-binding protein [Rickettsiella endosymbiont of Aleochara curtula]|uniref:methionine ABC transporter ATP-binding protein n=1 Tax=Rickettsiella endosymbiont of Aleochara curtula TaxID=3077936 RepID=UPI00313D86F1
MIELIDIAKIYNSLDRPIYALRNINLSIRQGEIFGIVGQSGAGKSTLIRCINLLERPSQGQVWVDKQELSSLKIADLRLVRRQIGMIFQQFNLLTAKTVYENIALPLKFAHYSASEIQAAIAPLLHLTGLSDKQHAYPSQLSGGQKQRVAIARALASQPKVLLCDEATSALDPHTTQTILQLLKDINQRLGITIVLITHQIDVVKSICDRVGLLDQGSIIEIADVVSFFTDPKTSLAQKFVSVGLKHELPPLLQKRLHAQKKACSHAVLRIIFQGHAAAEPLIAHVMREMGIHLNILQANIECLKETILGIMVVEVMGDQAPLPEGIQYLINKGLHVEIMGYVDESIV